MGTGQDVVELGAKAIAWGSWQTVLKMTLVLVLGSAGLRLRAATRLLALGAAIGLGLWWNG